MEYPPDPIPKFYMIEVAPLAACGRWCGFNYYKVQPGLFMRFRDECVITLAKQAVGAVLAPQAYLRYIEETKP